MQTPVISPFKNFSGLEIAIIAPGGYAPDEAEFEQAIAALEQQGCKVHCYYTPSNKFHRFGGSDEERLNQLHSAAQNKDVQIILSLRGGYGMTRLLPYIDYRLLADSGKLFVGHSDFTALQLALLAQAATPSFAGPMFCIDFTRPDISDFTIGHFWNCISKADYALNIPAAGNPDVQVSGQLWGGNLSMVVHLLGTPYFPQMDGGILFLEDVNEHPYRVERMLMQLFHAGVLHQQKAVLLGSFSAYKLVDYDNGYDFDAMLTYIRERIQVPVITGLPFGHIKDKVTLPVGCTANLISDSSSLQLQMTGYPCLAS